MPRLEVPLFARYLAVGGLNTVFGYGIIILCMALAGMSPVAANAIGFAVGFMFSFLMHRRFTFRSSVGLSHGLAAYLPVVAIGYVANVTVLLISTEAVGLNPYIAQVVALATHVAVTFIASGEFVFTGKLEDK